MSEAEATQSASPGSPIEPECGSRVVVDTREGEGEVVVVGIRDKTAGEYEIPALAGRTPAQVYRTDNRVEDGTGLVDVVYTSSLNHYEDKEEVLPLTDPGLVYSYKNGLLEETRLTVYTVPLTLIKSV